MTESETANDREPEIPENDAEPRKQNLASDIFDWVEMFVFAVAAVFTLFTFVFRIAVVNGPSMMETLHHNDILVVSELGYKPKAGDVVVLQTPYFGFDEPIVKRIIATGGQTISIDFENWTVYVDGEALREEYVNYVKDVYMTGWNFGDSYTVPEGSVFCMGDNRNRSTDSRAIGAVDEELIVGRVVFRLYPDTSIIR